MLSELMKAWSQPRPQLASEWGPAQAWSETPGFKIMTQVIGHLKYCLPSLGRIEEPNKCALKLCHGRAFNLSLSQRAWGFSSLGLFLTKIGMPWVRFQCNSYHK